VAGGVRAVKVSGERGDALPSAYLGSGPPTGCSGWMKSVYLLTVFSYGRGYRTQGRAARRDCTALAATLPAEADRARDVKGGAQAVPRALDVVSWACESSARET